MAKICQSHQLFRRVFVPRARSMVDTSGKEGGWEWNRCIKVTIYATIIQRVFEKGKGRMVGSLMDSLDRGGGWYQRVLIAYDKVQE